MSSFLTFVEVAVLALAAWPAVRLLANPDFRRVAPRQFIALAFVLSLGAAFVVGIAVARPSWLHVVALIGGSAMAASAWRARSERGVAWGLPPGSLSFTASIEAIVDRTFYRERFARLGAVFKMLQFHRPAICVLGLERGHRLLSEHAESLGPAVLPFNRVISGGFLRYMDRATHAVYGGLFRRALSSGVVEGSRQALVASARRGLDAMAEACADSTTGTAAPGAFLERIVYESFLAVLFDIEPASESFDAFRVHYERLLERDISRPLSKKGTKALEALRRVVFEQAGRFDDRRLYEGETFEGPPGSSLEALLRADPSMPDQTCVDNLIFILRISSGNVLALLHWCLHCLGRHPEWVDRLRVELAAERAGAAGSELATRIVLETLRLHQSEYLYRVVRERFEFEGFVFPAGWTIRICVAESHRLPEQFEHAEVFNPDRFLSRDFSSNRYSPFGHGPHACNGVALTQAICRAVLEELTARFDWSVSGDGHYERDFRHWAHLRPSSNLMLSLGPFASDRASSSVREARG